MTEEENVTENIKTDTLVDEPIVTDTDVDPLPAVDEDEKTFGNTDIDGAKENVSDLVVFGDGDLFQLLSKASSQKEGWMKSTKAMDVPGGCVIQVTTQQGDNVAEALTFVPGVRVGKDSEGNKKLVKA